jgi:hypothetical protein
MCIWTKWIAKIWAIKAELLTTAHYYMMKSIPYCPYQNVMLSDNQGLSSRTVNNANNPWQLANGHETGENKFLKINEYVCVYVWLLNS